MYLGHFTQHDDSAIRSNASGHIRLLLCRLNWLPAPPHSMPPSTAHSTLLRLEVLARWEVRRPKASILPVCHSPRPAKRTTMPNRRSRGMITALKMNHLHLYTHVYASKAQKLIILMTRTDEAHSHALPMLSEPMTGVAASGQCQLGPSRATCEHQWEKMKPPLSPTPPHL
ncbi:hypothetical protein EGR_10747 [Echinococcus granulosus]|uniref:Uncharacterized protein n=1 Tax=Echinococcus granulosus TaxID=6210 RepID=W6TZX8_ECHGR|nr:hypothetical protein EGR_10747 [Echinococcus granulosus]EUB54390.1 hypothetical protein EGR_10747 [Echinococcus granulosus]